MPAPFAFPGHYWDEDKGRFFKIEATGTAPPGAPHSQQEVDAYNRRQQLVDQEQQRWNRRRQRQQLSSKGEDASHEDGSSGDVTARCKQHRRQQQQKQQQNRHHQRKPSKRARYASGSGGEPSSSSSPLMAEKIRLTLKRNALDEEDLKFVKNHLIDRHPRYGHEIGKADTGDYNRSFVGSRAARAAAAFAHGLEFKGAVPVLNEYQATNHEDNLFESRPPVMETTSAVPFDAASHYPPLLSETRITCMYVHGEEMNPGAGIVYTNYHEPGRFVGIKGQYIPVNEDG
ncbi:plasma membrane H+-ATPase [Sporothrix bragantina]|uniref:Plasma membrane H+-ATPase n=1 Tax=Sporothrix bragantina TaxID=671064 RepID=A0ABP0BBK4_9PEZI